MTGSLGFFAPEMLHPHRPIRPAGRAFWSAGVLALEVLIGTPDFDALWFVAYNTEYKQGTLMQDRRADDGADVHAIFAASWRRSSTPSPTARRRWARSWRATPPTPKSPARAAPCCASTRPRARRRSRGPRRWLASRFPKTTGGRDRQSNPTTGPQIRSLTPMP